MKLERLTLENFQGLRSLELDFGGNDATVYGANGAGKTTICNAVTWLLFDRPSTGAKGWTPKTRDMDGEVHNLEHSAEAVFLLDNGAKLFLKKTFKEIWKKKRGAMNPEYSGNSVSYFVNGVPSMEREYKRAVDSICGDIERMRLLTTPDYFPAVLSWQDRRAILLEICGDVSDEDVINGTEELAELPYYLMMPGTTAESGQTYTVDEYAKIVKARKQDLNRQLETIPSRIDEAKRAIPPAAPVDEQSLDACIRATNERLNDLRAQNTAAQSGDVSTLTTALSAAKSRYAEAETKYTLDNSEAIKGIWAAVKAATEEAGRHGQDQDDSMREFDRLTAEIKRMTEERETVLHDYTEAQKAVWTADMEVCPTCGQTLPPDKVQKLREEFNLGKSKTLELLNEKGKAVGKDKIAALQKKAKEAFDRADAAAKLEDDCRKRADAIEAQLASKLPYSETEEGKAALAKIRDMEERISDARNDVSAVGSELAANIKACTDELDGFLRTKAEIAAAKRQADRVAELEAEEKRLAREYEDAEKGAYLCERFVVAKVAMLTDRINERFSNVSFRLFKEQVNGGLTECCDVMVPSPGAMVPYADANTAGRINAGLEIIGVLSTHYGVQMPLLVDGAESVTSLVPVDTQVIRFVVSPEDKVLRMEVSE